MTDKDGLWLRPDDKQSSQEAIAIIVLHGLGASCHDFVPFCKVLSAYACGISVDDLHDQDLKAMQDAAPRPITYVLPQAPTQPVGIASNFPIPAWFNIYGMERDCKKDLEGLKRCSDYVFTLTEKLNGEGIPDDRIFIGGFSQGGIVALDCLCREPHRFAGAFVISSCFLIHNPYIPSDSTTPVYFSHGEQDDVIPLDYARQSCKLLKDNGFDVVMHTQAELAHTMNAETANRLGRWIDKILQIG